MILVFENLLRILSVVLFVVQLFSYFPFGWETKNVLALIYEVNIATVSILMYLVLILVVFVEHIMLIVILRDQREIRDIMKVLKRNAPGEADAIPQDVSNSSINEASDENMSLIDGK